MFYSMNAIDDRTASMGAKTPFPARRHPFPGPPGACPRRPVLRAAGFPDGSVHPSAISGPDQWPV